MSVPSSLWQGACALGVLLLTSGCAGGAPSSEARGSRASLAGEGGAPASDRDLTRKLHAALLARGPDYRPRTRHLNPDGSARYTNRLILEGSPYLIQHAHNPVDWYPWGDEAFETARRLGRPVLLSVGYSTCHWCHVMEEESFEDEEIAREMNESYVAIKVDREERPDVDAIYMKAVQAMTGGGGWPMTVWLTPDRKPFFGGTYFPARDGDRGARVGFLTLLRRLKQSYDSERDRIAETASQLGKAIEAGLTPSIAGDLPGAAPLRDVVRSYRASFDGAHGGLNRAPKFPSSLPVRLLFRYHLRTADGEALKMAALTLEKMAAGGIHDQVGGGFHRYSTDARWLVPHFEKMLYDNALLALGYLEGYQVTRRKDFAEVAERIFRYVERDMTSPEGAFYSATDADSPAPDGRREEGWFFTWTPAEIEAALGPDRSRVAVAVWGVTPHGNFENRNILHVPKPLEEVARDLKMPAAKVRAIVDESRELLYRARARRPAPLRDDKVLTAWNGLMISALARGSLTLDNEECARRAERAAGFILGLKSDGRLFRSYQAGQARHNAYLDDYAFLTAGLLDLFEATGDARWLREAAALDRVLERHYEDPRVGGFFLTSEDHEKLLVREKPAYDGAEPSGNSVAILNLLRLHELTTEDRYRQRAERALKAFGGVLKESPEALSEMLMALDFHLDTPKEIVIVTPRTIGEAAPLIAELRKTFLPNRVLIVASEGRDLEEKARIVPLLAGKVASRGKATAYVCEKRVCQLPTADPGLFARQISKVAPLPGSAGPP